MSSDDKISVKIDNTDNIVSTEKKTRIDLVKSKNKYRLTLFKKNSMKGSGNIIGEGAYGMVFEASSGIIDSSSHTNPSTSTDESRKFKEIKSNNKSNREHNKHIKSNEKKHTFAIKRNYVGKVTSLFCCVKELDIFVRLNKSPFIVNLRGTTIGSPVKNIKESNTLNKKKYRRDDMHFIFEKGEYDGRTLIYSDKSVSYAYMKLIMCHILLGLEYMHSKNIIHRDLKPDNIIWFRYGNHRVAKICDFGMSHFHTYQTTSETGIVTPWSVSYTHLTLPTILLV